MAKKKKLKPTKKEKKKQSEIAAKQRAEEEEAERIRFKKEEKERIKREAQEAKERAEREIVEHRIRNVHLVRSCQQFNKNMNISLERILALHEAEEWMLYLKCNGLPNPLNGPEVNTYLHVWKLDTTNTDIEHHLSKTEEVLYILSVLANLIESPLEYGTKQIATWKEIRDNLREELQNCLNNCTYTILRKLELNLEQIDLETVTYLKESPFLVMSLWTWLKIPRPLKDCRPPPFLNFPQVGVSIMLPPEFINFFLVVRAIWLKYDHYSELCPTWDAKPLPPWYLLSLIDVLNLEYGEKDRIKREQYAEDIGQLEEIIKKTKKKWHYTPPEEEEISSLETPELKDPLEFKEDLTDKITDSKISLNTTVTVLTTANNDIESELEGPQLSKTELPIQTIPPDQLLLLTQIREGQEPRKTASEIMAKQKHARTRELQEHLEVVVGKGELNMRCYVILGGVYHLDLLYQPPQPKVLQDHTVLTVFEGEHKLQHVEYVKYLKRRSILDNEENLTETIRETHSDTNHNQDVTEVVDLEIEEEMDEQTKTCENSIFVAVTIAMPKTVLWFEPPSIVQWDKENRIWTNTNIHEEEFNHEQQILSFKTTVMAPIGLAFFRFINLPYQTWKIRPHFKCKWVDLSISAANVHVEFIIKPNKVAY